MSDPPFLWPVEHIHSGDDAQNGVLCAGNMMLTAHSLGIGSCWIGFASSLGEDPGVLKDLGVPEGHRLIAPLIFGYPKKVDGTATPRNDPVILKWVKDQ
ncbi:MAG: nitroreductase family protein [Methanomassiliicoccales archaeon]|nr:nitroreductase family protein [Methanomassiliicoccales archaeon]TFG56460.1 MAG: nitroreductase family protein [Methanomassiliicoccus sp.]